MKLFSKALVLGAALTLTFAAEARSRLIRCESRGHNYRECPVGGELIQVRLVEQHSNADCRANETWGADWHGNDYIWVDEGCRATFRVWLEDENDDDDDMPM